MRFGAISKINPVILEFVRKYEKTKNDKKDKIEAKNLKFKDVLVKIMFNLECGNI
ncbi:MAG: hypothetical protein V8R26_05880 [Clostridia bacterium]